MLSHSSSFTRAFPIKIPPIRGERPKPKIKNTAPLRAAGGRECSGAQRPTLCLTLPRCCLAFAPPSPRVFLALASILARICPALASPLPCFVLALSSLWPLCALCVFAMCCRCLCFAVALAVALPPGLLLGCVWRYGYTEFSRNCQC